MYAYVSITQCTVIIIKKKRIGIMNGLAVT